MSIKINPDVLRRAAIVLGALDNKSRCKIVNILLENNETSFATIHKRMPEMKQSTLSGNLQCLKDAGLVTYERTRKSAKLHVTLYYPNKMHIEAAWKCANLLAAMPPDGIKNPA